MIHSFTFALLAVCFCVSWSAGVNCSDTDLFAFQEVGGNYPPVTAKQLLKAKYSHRTGTAKYDFDWKFKQDQFLIEGKAIPQDLLDLFLGEGKTATRIAGTWSISDGMIRFVVKTGAKEANKRKCKLPIYFTGVIRIETKKAQYVF